MFIGTTRVRRCTHSCGNIPGAQVLPEVKAREEAERRVKEEERLKLAQAIAEGKATLPVAEEDSEEEEAPDLEIQIPTSKVKRVVGPGGAIIKEIQKKSK
jgi:hypothetical protein